jgi:hypothetical protein
MKVENNNLIRISLIIFFIGLFLGMVILGIAVMGDSEATIFHANPGFSGEPLSSLNCPVMVDTSEEGIITATVPNPSDSRTSPSVWTSISAGSFTLVREERENLILEPGESQKLQWTISADDAAFGNWILVKVNVFSQYPLSPNLSYCGIFVADMKGFTGDQVFTFSLAASVLLLGLGAGLWHRSTKHLRGKAVSERRRSLVLVGGMLVIGLTATVLGSHLVLVSGIIFILNLIATVILILWGWIKA